MEDDGFDDPGISRCDERLVFSDEATFHVSGKVNKHNTCIWSIDNPHELLEHQRNSPKGDHVLCYVEESCIRTILLLKSNRHW